MVFLFSAILLGLLADSIRIYAAFLIAQILSISGVILYGRVLK